MSNNPFNNYGMDYISSLNNAYRDAQVRNSNFTLPDGKYQAALTYIALLPSKLYENELQLCLGFTVIDGEYKGHKLSKYQSIIPENMDRLKTDMTVLGLDLEGDITKLGEQDVLESLLDTIVDLTIKSKAKTKGNGFYTNVYLNRKAGMLSGENMIEADEDDDNPFA